MQEVFSTPGAATEGATHGARNFAAELSAAGRRALRLRAAMRAETDRAKLERFMAALGERVSGAGTVYLTGGATALLQGWRKATIDVDIKPDPEPPGLFEAIPALKDELDINVELASPDQFIPPIPGWRERSVFIARHGSISYYHYDPYGQALSKLQRGHERDLADVRSLVREKAVKATAGSARTASSGCFRSCATKS